MSIQIQIILGTLLIAVIIGLTGVLLSTLKENKYLKTKYSKIINMDELVEKRNREKRSIEKVISDLRKSYSEKKQIHDKLMRIIAIYDEEVELTELGFYKPHFDYDTSEKFKEKIVGNKARQKELLKSKEAIYCNTEWNVEGSKAKGRTMTNRNIRLTARAFNNECDAAIANVRWNNALRMEARIQKAFEAINKLNESNKIFISLEYFELKLEELRLTHEYKEKKQKEKEEQAEIRRQMREEEKLQKEI